MPVYSAQGLSKLMYSIELRDLAALAALHALMQGLDQDIRNLSGTAFHPTKTPDVVKVMRPELCRMAFSWADAWLAARNEHDDGQPTPPESKL